MYSPTHHMRVHTRAHLKTHKLYVIKWTSYRPPHVVLLTNRVQQESAQHGQHACDKVPSLPKSPSDGMLYMLLCSFCVTPASRFFSNSRNSVGASGRVVHCSKSCMSAYQFAFEVFRVQNNLCDANMVRSRRPSSFSKKLASSSTVQHSTISEFHREG